MAVSEKDRAVWTDVYRMYAACFPKQDSDDYWDGICKKMTELSNKHQSELCDKLLAAIYDAL